MRMLIVIIIKKILQFETETNIKNKSKNLNLPDMGTRSLTTSAFRILYRDNATTW